MIANRQIYAIIAVLLPLLFSCASASGDRSEKSTPRGEIQQEPLQLSNAPLPSAESVLQAATRFYGAQRSGTTDNWLIAQYPEEKRIACFDRDGESLRPGLDLSGGWHDAGDYLKFTLTTAWSAYALLKAYDAFPQSHADLYDRGYGAPNGIPDILDEVKWATDYLLKAHLDSATLVTQIGDKSDHENGTTCPTMSRYAAVERGGQPRKVWFGDSSDDPSRVKADVLGITAAALALMGVVYEEFDLEYADRCITHALQLYATAKARPGNTLEPPGQSFYQDNSFLDDLLCGAVELYRATSDRRFLKRQFGKRTARRPRLGLEGLSTATLPPSLAIVGEEGRRAALPDWGKAISRYFTNVSKEELTRGLAYFNDWGSLRLALNSAFSAALYSTVTGDTTATDFALKQLDWVLGNNGYNRSFVVGMGHNPPTAPHHKNGFGKDRWATERDQPLLQLNRRSCRRTSPQDYKRNGPLPAGIPRHHDRLHHQRSCDRLQCRIGRNDRLQGLAHTALITPKSGKSARNCSFSTSRRGCRRFPSRRS